MKERYGIQVFMAWWLLAMGNKQLEKRSIHPAHIELSDPLF